MLLKGPVGLKRVLLDTDTDTDLVARGHVPPRLFSVYCGGRRHVTTLTYRNRRISRSLCSREGMLCIHCYNLNLRFLVTGKLKIFNAFSIRIVRKFTLKMYEIYMILFWWIVFCLVGYVYFNALWSKHQFFCLKREASQTVRQTRVFAKQRLRPWSPCPEAVYTVNIIAHNRLFHFLFPLFIFAQTRLNLAWTCPRFTVVLIAI